MRKSYVTGDGHEISWGFDNVGGFFLQHFNDTEEVETFFVNADQGDILTGMTIASEYLSYDLMESTLKENSSRALADFNAFVNQTLPEELRGHISSTDGRYRELPQILTTWKDLFLFLDKNEPKLRPSGFLQPGAYYYQLTNFFDLEVSIEDLFQYAS